MTDQEMRDTANKLFANATADQIPITEGSATGEPTSAFRNFVANLFRQESE